MEAPAVRFRDSYILKRYHKYGKRLWSLESKKLLEYIA